jgi:hypothetical protein
VAEFAAEIVERRGSDTVNAADLEVHMVIRVFRARLKAGHTADELARMAEEATLPSLERERGLVARYAGTGLGETGEEFTVISVWKDLDALKKMTGDDWERPLWPDPRAKELIAEVFMHHYGSIG